MKKEYIIVIAFGILLITAVFFGRSTVKPEYINVIPDSTAAYITSMQIKIELLLKDNEVLKNSNTKIDSLNKDLQTRYNRGKHEKPDNYSSLAAADAKEWLWPILNNSIVARQLQYNDSNNVSSGN